MKKQFYEKALPTQGVYCATSIKNGKAVNRFARTLSDLYNVIDELKEGGSNVFVALNSFSGFSRKGDDAVFCRSFFIDLDVGDAPKKYASKTDALYALDKFLDDTGVPMPVVIDSGTGVHAYWLFDRDVPSAEWKVYAEKWKAFCLEHLHIDPTVTADKARIMRCPETYNYKTDPPTPTKFLTDSFGQCDFDSFKEALGEEEIPTDMALVLAAAVKGLDESTAGVAKIDPNIETVFAVLAQKSIDDEGGCKQVDYILRNAATLSEPQWYDGLTLARACVDWEEAIHDMSSPYPAYTCEATLKKANQAVNKDGKVMVHGCEVIESNNPGGCDGCPFRGKITNPLALARRVKAATTPSENAVRSDENPETVPVYTTFPKELEPFYRGPDGGVWFDPPAKKDKGGNWVPQIPVELWKYDLYPIKRMYGQQDGECLMMRHILPHDDIRDFLLPMSSVYSSEDLKKLCSRYGVFYNPEMTPVMVKYLVKWGEVMLGKQGAELTRMQMGWTEDCNGFVVGNVEYTRDGRTIKTAASPLIQSVASLLKPSGSYELWKAAAQRLDKEGYEIHAFSMLCGFGSPLIRMTTVKGVTVGLIGRTGAAKSGAMFAQASLFGDPYGLSLAGAKKGATENSLIQFMMGLKNIGMCLDEASNYKPEDISELLYKVTQGKNKMRLQASVNAIREIEQSAALITTLTSNQSMKDKVKQNKSNPDGELARYVEIPVERPPSMDATEGKLVFDPFRQNYGYAGPEYIKYVLSVGDDYVMEKINKWVLRFLGASGGDAGMRYYEALVACAFAGGELAAEAGIVNFNLDRIYLRTITSVIAMKESTSHKADYEAMLGNFQNEHQSNTLVINEERVVREPRYGALVARFVTDEDMYYVSRTALQKFLAKGQVSEDEFVFAMKEKGILTYTGKLRLAAGWMRLAAVSVYGFKDAIPADFFGDAPSNGN